MRLADKIALVTGAGKGIGRAIAMGFGREGATVWATDIDAELAKSTASEITAAGGKAFHARLDISQLDAIDEVVTHVMGTSGRIDILVNNAGVAVFMPFLEVTPEIVERIWNVNLRGTFFVSQRVAREMVKQRRGKIISMSSLSEEVGTPLLTHYSTTKGGIKIMTRCMALELAEYNIQVNAVGPGIIDTDISREYFSIPENRAAAVARIPAGRMGEPEDIVGAALFLASDESDYVTGTTVFVDGGLLAQ